MLHSIAILLLVAAFAGAGIFNAIARPAMQRDYVRWGYPAWWCRVTGVLELASAGLIAFPITRVAGLALGVAILAAAIVTVVRHRDFSHLVPLGVFVLLALAVTLS